MKNSPKISVIIPVYNVEPYLRKCLDSVINQSLKDIEIICVNDGSTDGSPAILEEYAKKDKRITIINQENQKQGAARNSGLAIANGEYIQFVDSDDWIDKNCCKKCYGEISKTDADFLIFSMCRYDEKSNKIIYDAYDSCKCYEPNKRKSFNYKEVRSVMLRCWDPPRKLIKKDFLIKNNLLFERGVYYEDVLFHVQCFYLAKEITILDEPLYCYRIRPESTMTGSYTKKKIDDVFHFISAVKEFLKKNNIFEFLKNEYADFAAWQIMCHYQKQTTLKKYFIFQMKNFFKSNKDDLSKDWFCDILIGSRQKFFKKVKYKNGKKITRYFGGIIKKVKGEKSKKIYLFGVQIWSKRR